MSAPQNLPIALGAKGIAPANVSELQSLAEMMVKGGLFKGSAIEAACVVGMGAELGLSPFQSIQVIKSINGKFSVFGDGITALLHASGKLGELTETVDGQCDARTATCSMQRVGMPAPIVSRFSVADAKRAGLWGKQGPWTQYPDRMLTMRARGFAARDGFSDVLRGIISAEEAQDYPRPTVSASKPLPGTAPKAIEGHQAPAQPYQEALVAEFQAETARVLGDSPAVPGSPGALGPRPLPAYIDHGVAEPVRPDMHPAQKLAIRQGLKLSSPQNAENDGEPVTRVEYLHRLGVMLSEMFPGDRPAMADFLEINSGFEGRDGNRVKGFSSLQADRLKGVSDKWIQATYGKIKEAWMEMTGRKLVSGGVDAPGGAVPEPEAAPAVQPEVPFLGLSADGAETPF